jgi:hypothetical protein
MKVLIPISKNLGTVRQSGIKKFLMTFGEVCKTNVEYSQWSNELLFDLLDKQTELTLRTIEKEEQKIEKLAIIKVLQSPLLDRVNIKKLKERIEKITIKPTLKNEIIKALESAMGKS